MKEFPVITANKNSISRRKLVHGVGVNDADYKVSPQVNGVRFICPFYRKWRGMINRCYSEKYKNKNPTYVGCTVCSSWLMFSNFKRWMITQDWKNKDIDKDIVKTGNKIYSPDTCIFISHYINSILNDSSSRRGDYPRGVHLHKQSKKFKAQCNVNNKRTHIGLFLTQKDALIAYVSFKSKLILSEADRHPQPLKGYLIRISKELNS